MPSNLTRTHSSALPAPAPLRRYRMPMKHALAFRYRVPFGRRYDSYSGSR